MNNECLRMLFRRLVPVVLFIPVAAFAATYSDYKSFNTQLTRAFDEHHLHVQSQQFPIGVRWSAEFFRAAGQWKFLGDAAAAKEHGGG